LTNGVLDEKIAKKLIAGEFGFIYLVSRPSTHVLNTQKNTETTKGV
jgi:hypothetical protein